MSYLLDTDTCSAAIRNVRLVANRYSQNRGNLHISVVSITELELWLVRPGTPLRRTHGFFGMLRNVTLLDVTEAIAHRAAQIGSGLRRGGRRGGLADLLTAATALEHGLTLVSHATQPFASIPGLTVVDWAAP